MPNLLNEKWWACAEAMEAKPLRHKTIGIKAEVSADTVSRFISFALANKIVQEATAEENGRQYQGYELTKKGRTILHKYRELEEYAES